MSFNSKRSISLLLRPFKGNSLPKNVLFQIQKIIASNHSKIYHYDILSLYHHFVTSKDTQSFAKIDNIIFPNRGRSPIIDISFPLALRRLFCLIKFQMPYNHWIDVVRQLMHEAKLDATFFRFLLTFNSFARLRLDENFLTFYNQAIEYLEEDFQNIDPFTLISIRRNYEKEKIITKSSKQVKQKIDDQLDKYAVSFSSSQAKFLCNTKVLQRNWLYLYSLKCRFSSWRKVGFFLDFLSRNAVWKKWALDNFGRDQIFNRLPKQQIPIKSSTIIEKILSNYNMSRPYIDEFFEFEEVKRQDGSTRIKLKDPQISYGPYLNNVYYSLFTGFEVERVSMLQKIDQVLEDVQYIPVRSNSIFMYFSVKNILTYFMAQNKQEKRKQEIENLKITNSLISQISQKDLFDSRINEKLFLIRLYRQMSSFEFEVYSIPEFKNVYGKLNQIFNRIYDNLAILITPFEIRQQNLVIKEYLSRKPPTQNHLLFGQFQQLQSPHPHLIISAAKQVEVNKTLMVDYLVKVQNKETGQEARFCVDLFVKKTYYGAEFKTPIPIPIRIYSKYKYMTEWCKLRYIFAEETSIDKFIRGQKFGQILSSDL